MKGKIDDLLLFHFCVEDWSTIIVLAWKIG